MKVETIHFKLGDGSSGLIRAARHQLEGYRSTTSKLEELEWEIRVYDFILNHKTPDEAAGLFLRTRHRSGIRVSKREAVRILGWEIE